MGNHWIGSLAVVALAGAHVGCASMFREVAKGAVPEVLASAVTELADPVLQRQVVAAVDEGRVKELTARLSAGIVDGVLDALEDPARRHRLEAIVDGLATSAAGSATDSVLAHALDEKVQVQMRLALAAEQTVAFGAAAHELAKQATLGFQDALDDTRRDRASGRMPKADGALLIAANNASKTGGEILWTLGIGLGVLALGLIVTLTWAIRKNKRRRSDMVQRDDALTLLTDAIKSTASQPGAQDLHAALKTSLRDQAGADHVRKVLGEKGRQLLGIDVPR